MHRSGRNGLAAVAALVAVALPVIACGGEDEQEELSPNLRALAAASDIADLTARLAPITESVADDPGKANRDEAADRLADLGAEASALGDEIAGELDQPLVEPVVAASSCFAGAFATLGDAVSSPRGEDAQTKASEARSEVEDCLQSLSAATERLRANARAEAETLRARISSHAEAIDGLLAGVVGALAAPGAEEPPDLLAEPEPEAGAPEQAPATAPAEELPPAEPGGFEAADLPECSAAPPPCREGGSVVEP